MRFNQKHRQIGIGSAPPGRFHHRAIQTAFGAEDSRGVYENNLRLPLECDTANTGAGGLHLMGYDRNLGPHHTIEQGRFPCIRFPDQGHKSGACAHAPNLSNNNFAAACSAWRFDPALACAASPECNLTSISNCGA